MMGFAVLQVLLTAAACYALWRLWTAFRSAAAGDRTMILIVAAGFLARALAAQALFWISYLRLPFLRSMQSGNGFWFFASDGPFYFFMVDIVLHRDGAPFSWRALYPSRVYLELLSVFVTAFGNTAFVAILLNCAAFLGTCLLLLRIGATSGRVPRLFALAAISLSPGAILWATQALKEPLFAFVVVALAAACYAWQELWRRAPRRSAVILVSAAMLAAFYALAGLRWYVAVVLWGVVALFFVLVARPAPQRARAVVCAVVLFALIPAVVRVGAADDIIPFVAAMRKFLRLDAASSIPNYLKDVRGGFENTPGATSIAAGPAIAPPAPPLLPPEGEKVPKADEGPRPNTPPPPPPQPQPQPPPQPPPQTTSARLITGIAATFLPRTIAQGLGLIEVGGGRGLWLFVELDTLVFDAVALFAIGWCAVALVRKRARVTPLFIFLALVFLLIAVPMMYSVNNFGTLFRLRQIFYIVMAMLPLSLRESAVEGR